MTEQAHDTVEFLHQGELMPQQYVQKVMQKELHDPVLTTQIANGFVLLQLIPDYYPSDEDSGGDSHDTWSALDYFVWAVVGKRRTFLVDTGFTHEVAAQRDRQLTRLPREGLALLGIDAAEIRDVIITHLHYDHADTFSDFRNARLHLQDEEMAYATGRHMTRSPFTTATRSWRRASASTASAATSGG